MELLHRRCCGLDVHKETVVACSVGEPTSSVGSLVGASQRLEPFAHDGFFPLQLNAQLAKRCAD
jgi:hypothetical protein